MLATPESVAVRFTHSVTVFVELNPGKDAVISQISYLGPYGKAYSV